MLAEGESDAQTLWLHNVPALGLPGADSWREDRDAALLDGFKTIYVVIEPDRGGDRVLAWLSKSRIRERVRLVTIEGAKDPSALYLADPGRFRERWADALSASVLWTERAAAETASHHRAAEETCRGLAAKEHILDEFAQSMERSGVVGEERAKKVLYLALVSRLFDRPVSIALKGPSSGGKSFLAERVQAYFPPQAYFVLTAMRSGRCSSVRSL